MDNLAAHMRKFGGLTYVLDRVNLKFDRKGEPTLVGLVVLARDSKVYSSQDLKYNSFYVNFGELVWFHKKNLKTF